MDINLIFTQKLVFFDKGGKKQKFILLFECAVFVDQISNNKKSNMINILILTIKCFILDKKYRPPVLPGSE